MKTLILIPCFDMLPAHFLRSLLQMQIIGEVGYDIATSSLIYDARNQLAQHAISGGYDYALWLDSDTLPPSEALWKLKVATEEGYDMVSGLYFQRKPPFGPTIYKRLELMQLDGGKLDPVAEQYTDYPRGELFEIQGCGFGCTFMTVDLLRRVTDQFGILPFMPVGGFGEDLSFCMRARRAGAKIGCDSSVRCGHVGRMVFDEAWADEWRETHGNDTSQHD